MRKERVGFDDKLELGENDFVYKRVRHSFTTVTYEVVHKEGLKYKDIAVEIDPVSGVFGFTYTKSSENHVFITINVD